MENTLLKALKAKEEELLIQLKVTRDMIAEEQRKNKKAEVSIEEESKTPGSVSVTSTPSESESVETYIHKFLRVLKENKRFMKIREMAEYINKTEGGEVSAWIKRFTTKTGKLQVSGKIIKHQVGKSRVNTYWGSPNWLNGDGNIKDEFKYDESSFTETGGSNLDDFEL